MFHITHEREIFLIECMGVCPVSPVLENKAGLRVEPNLKSFRITPENVQVVKESPPELLWDFQAHLSCCLGRTLGALSSPPTLQAPTSLWLLLPGAWRGAQDAISHVRPCRSGIFLGKAPSPVCLGSDLGEKTHSSMKKLY